jgi:uncharacterized protein (DUF1778 family)
LWLQPPRFLQTAYLGWTLLQTGCTTPNMLGMRSIHFRVSDGMYVLIQQGSEDAGASVAHFCREAAIARAVLWEARRGFKSTDPAVWEPILEQIREIDDHDARLRADLARQRRVDKEVPREEPSA